MITYCPSVRLDGSYHFHYRYGYRSQNCSSTSKVVNQLSDWFFIIPAGYAARAFSRLPQFEIIRKYNLHL